LRVALLHPPIQGGGTGPLAEFVKERRRLSLDLLLLAHAAWPSSDSGTLVASSTEWINALGMEDRSGTRAIVSRSWSWLEQHKLIETTRHGRMRAITILTEDGSGRPWQHPFDSREPYLKLPYAYWRGGFASDLGLPAKAILLIGTSLQSRQEPYFELPLRRGAAWYGLTERTLRAGIRELREKRLLRTWTEPRATDRSPVGTTFDRRYRLNEIAVIAQQRGPS
jgi:hypothetical protein